ncbi:MAG: MFS transporter, partial [Pseudomonadota bacterium]
GALIGVVGSGSVLTVIALCFFAAAALGLIHPGGGAPPGQSDRATMAEAATMLRSRLFLVFALSAALGHAAHAVYYTYSVVAWREAGIAAFWVGALWASGVLAEIVLMLGPGRRWIATIGPARGLALAGLAGLLRWSAMTLEPVGPLLWVAQILHAGSFGIAHLAAMAFIAAAVPARLGGTAQGLANGLIGGLTLAGATMLAGIGVPYLGLGGIYWIAAALALTATIFALVLALSWRGGRILD